MCASEAHRGADEYKEGGEWVDAAEAKAEERGSICVVYAWEVAE